MAGFHLMNSWLTMRQIVIVSIFAAVHSVSHTAYTLVDKMTTDCELEALSTGTRLADQYNMYDEGTEWDTRIHNDYLVEHLGFAGWIQMGLWKNTKQTAEHRSAVALHQVIKQRFSFQPIESNLKLYTYVSIRLYIFDAYTCNAERWLGRQQEHHRICILVTTEPMGLSHGRLNTETSVGHFCVAFPK